MKAKYLDDASVRVLQQTSPTTEHLVRFARVSYLLAFLPLNLLLVGADVLFGTTHYGLRNWSWKTRTLQFLIANVIWALNPGVRPVMDVLSKKARSSAGSLKPDQGAHRASYVEVPPRPDKLLGDAIHPAVAPEAVSCFWQWLESMPSPLDTVSLEDKVKQKVMMYFVGGAMIQGHPIQSPLPYNLMPTTSIPIFGVNFRKAITPETAFPAALHDAVAAFYYLLDQGYSAKNICIMGDSGGAGIVITVLLYLRRHELDLPGSSALLSPFVDLVDDFSDDPQKLKYDILNPEILSSAAYLYTQNRPELRFTLLSPARNDLPEGYTFVGLPKMIVDYGDTEIFAPGIRNFVAQVKKSGVQLEVIEAQDKIHCYSYDVGDGIASGIYGKLASCLDAD
ncbi:Alpha/Beta hydrolase protein [Leptodontidium sp. 2 PMI_412]|nr:Alpha/Beta hydrolase protein [Leptodontidium sp. 2 PMI_412]